MSSAACTILGSAVLALLLAGYLAQHYLPPPKPKIVGIDLGTTYSCVGVYYAGSGHAEVLKDSEGHKCIPSIVAFSEDSVVIGYKASHLSDVNPKNTVYDAKRFIGKKFTKDELLSESARYSFEVNMDQKGVAYYRVGPSHNRSHITPQGIGAYVISTLKQTAERNLSVPVTKAVMAVPAEFSPMQRNYTREAAKLAGIEVLRIINEPTAAALAYGLHKRDDIHFIMVVDLGGGTLDVSLLNVQGGMFLTQAMAGNNHLGGQDFTERLLEYLLQEIFSTYGQTINDALDLQTVRLAAEKAKLTLSNYKSATVHLSLSSVKLGPTVEKGERPVKFTHNITREQFEKMTADLLLRVLEPINRVLTEVDLNEQDIDEIVLVGGSTRIPKVRNLIHKRMKRPPNVAIDPELAVALGVSIQAGILGGAWPLAVSATELPTSISKIQIH